MKITLIQMDIAWAQPQANIETAERLISASSESDVYVLPEMWTTGFVTEPEGIAESESGEGLAWMIKAAGQYDAAIVGSIATMCSDGSYRNRLYFVRPDGSYQYYDKHHLFSYGTETYHYTPGDERVVVEYKGVRFLLLVCYDLRFPVWSRYRGDYDAIIYVASWPVTRVAVWSLLLKARAVENQCYVIGVNRIGTDPTCTYTGASAFVDAYGRGICCKDSQEDVITAVIDIPSLVEFRRKFPVLLDRDMIE